MNRIWLISVIALVVNAAIGIYNVDGLLDSQRIVTHTRTVQVALAALLTDILNAETGQRGYLVTESREFLEPYYVALGELAERKLRVRNEILDNPEQITRMDDLDRLIAKRLIVFKESIEQADKGDFARARAIVAKGRGKSLMDEIRADIQQMTEAESKLMNLRTRDVNRKFWTTVLVNIVGTTLALIVVCLAHFSVRRELVFRTAAEEMARRASDRLEVTVEARTKALTATSTELLRSNQELEKFAYVASHDLQEPLRKIQAFGDRLAQKSKDTLDDQGRDYVARMQAAATRMRTLITDLLTFSRISTQGRPVTEVDLGEILAGVVSDLEPQIDACDGRIDIGPMPTVAADATQMRQLFQNLLANALKFRKPDVAPVVTVRATDATDLTAIASPPPPTSGWRFTVTDNGIGFDPSYAERIFELFQRLHGRGEYEGTGIGLAVCRKIVERHGGRITAHSRPGDGAQFIIDLPNLANAIGAPAP